MDYGGAAANDMQKLTVIALLLLATLATGFLVGNSGRSPNPLLSTIHKLLALAWVVLTAMLVYHSARQIETGAAFFTIVAVLALSTIALFWSGSTLTLPNTRGAGWITAHRIASTVAVIASALMARLILLHKP